MIAFHVDLGKKSVEWGMVNFLTRTIALTLRDIVVAKFISYECTAAVIKAK
jgi:hypothetical protein